MNKEIIKFSIPAESKYLTVLRLASSAIASSQDFSIDQVEDLKLCLSEVCNIGISSQVNDTINLEYHLSDDEIEVRFLDFKIQEEKVENFEMSKMILQALVEEMEFLDNSIILKLSK